MSFLALALTLASSTRAGDDAATCGECHEAVYAQWRTSRHAAAASNPVFRASWENWPNGWCLGCHAPQEAQQVELIGRAAVPGMLRGPLEAPTGDRWRDGVDCATCHVRDGLVLGSGTPTALAEDMHPMALDERLATEAVCATCHEFPVQKHTPAWPFAYGETPAQATVTEWRSSTAATAGTGCQDCHMAEHGHAFPGAHAPDLVREALDVSVSRRADGTVRATVSAPGAAHRVPTGDPFRRLVVDLCVDPACTEVRATQTLRRVFAPDGESWVEHADRTVPPERPGAPAVRTLDLSPSAHVGWWRLVYRYGDSRFEDALPPEEVGFEVAAGVVTLETP